MQQGNRRAIVAALVANAGIAVAKFVGFLFTGASSMLAEAVHSVADSSNQGLLLWGGVAARRAPTAQHPFGFGRERYFWSFVVALVIFSLGALFAIYEGISKLLHPHELTSPGWALGILGLAIALESYSFRTAIVEARAEKKGASWWEFVRHTRNPELPVVLLEDLGALIGLVLAMLGVGLATLTGDARYDAAGTLSIGVLLAGIAIVLAVEMKSLLLGESASPEAAQRIDQALEESPEVARVIHLRTLHLGPDELLIAAKLEFVRPLDLAKLSRGIDAVEARVRASQQHRCLIYIEPAVFDPDMAAAPPETSGTPGSSPSDTT